MAGIGAISPARAQNNTYDAPRFFEMMDDIPLMPGLEEIADGALVFDKPGGRIIEAKAVSEMMAPESITSFYETTLPQLGWNRQKHNDSAVLYFARQDEVLTLKTERNEGLTILHLLIRPAEAKSE